MNVSYAVKIFVALSIVAWVTKVVAGRGLRSILSPRDLKGLWLGIIGTLAVSCFSMRIGIFFVALPIWALFLSNWLGKEGVGRLPTYALLCCISPAITVEIEHIGPLNDLIFMTSFRMLALVLLLPEAVRLISRRETIKTPPWLRLCDVLTVTYVLFWLMRHFAVSSMSVIGRDLIGQMLDSLLPYYVLSRACVRFDVRQRFLAFLLAGVVYEAFVGIAESVSRHYLYAQLEWLYGADWGQSTGLFRGSWLRVEAAFPGPLVMAVLMLFGIGLWFVLKKPEKNRAYLVLLVGIVAALLATYGRGPILAGTALFLSVALLRRMSAKKYLVMMVGMTILISCLWQAGLGERVIALVSSISAGDETADFNVRYRQELLTTSLALLQQSPWFGVPNFVEQMANLRQGDGIIDLVNTYLVVALDSGLFGIALVFTPYALTLWREAGRFGQGAELRREGLPWIALTAGVMIAIFTVSPISIVQPILVWTVAIALARLQDSQGSLEPQEPVKTVPTGYPSYSIADANRW